MSKSCANPPSGAGLRGDARARGGGDGGAAIGDGRWGMGVSDAAGGGMGLGVAAREATAMAAAAAAKEVHCRSTEARCGSRRVKIGPRVGPWAWVGLRAGPRDWAAAALRMGLRSAPMSSRPS